MANPNDKVKNKQRNAFILIAVVIMVLAYIAVEARKTTDKNAAPTTPDDIVTEKYSALGSNIDTQEVWMQNSSNEIDDLKKENQRLVGDLAQIRQKMEAEIREQIANTKNEFRSELEGMRRNTEKRRLEQSNNTISPNQPKTAYPSPKVTANGSNGGSNSNAPFSRNGAIPTTTKNNGVKITTRYFADPSLADYKAPELGKGSPKKVAKKTENKLSSLDFFVEDKTDTVDSDENTSQVKRVEVATGTGVEDLAAAPVRRRADTYLPSGTFMRAIVLGALDAPTGGQAQDAPHPVLLEVDGIANLPNSFKANITQCRILGAGYGDISSERAFIRLEKMSCISTDGFIHESKIKGYVFGEDGKNGMRGHVVTKQGQLLANSLVAGIGAGIGKAFQQQSTSFATTPIGSVATIDPQAIGTAGVGSGVGSALDRLSKYYISLAEQTFPIIEIQAGRAIDVVLTSGYSLVDDGIENDSDSNGEIDLAQMGEEIASQAQENAGQLARLIRN